MKSKAAIFVAEKEPLILDEIEVDDPKEGEVLVKLSASGICHTDLHEMSGKANNPLMPSVLGHEGGGVVHKVGPGVKGLKEGDHVVPLYISECGECRECLDPNTNLCSALDDTYYDGVMPDGTTRLHWRGKDLHHFMGTSTFAEYAVVPEIALAKVREDAPLDRVCLLACGITTGIGAALWTAKVLPGSVCAVFGCGPIGLNALQGCKMAGADKIIALDFHDHRLEKAKEFGATDLVNARETDGVKAVKSMSDGGADFVFEATGNVHAMKQALEATRYAGGKCCLIGVAPHGEEISFAPRMVIAGRTLMGTAFGGCKGRTQLPEMVDWYMDGKIKIDELVTQEIPLEKINWALEEMAKDAAYRFVIKY